MSGKNKTNSYLSNQSSINYTETEEEKELDFGTKVCGILMLLMIFFLGIVVGYFIEGITADKRIATELCSKNNYDFCGSVTKTTYFIKR